MSIKEDQKTYTLDEVRTIARNALQAGREHSLAQLADITDHVSDTLQESFKDTPGSVSERQEAKGLLRAHAWLSVMAEALRSQAFSGADETIEQLIADLDAVYDNKRLKEVA